MLVAQGAITKVGYNMLNRVQCSDINQHKTLKAEEQKIINPMLPTETTVCGCLNGLYHQSIFSNSVTILGKPSYRRLCKNWSGVRGGDYAGANAAFSLLQAPGHGSSRKGQTRIHPGEALRYQIQRGSHAGNRQDCRSQSLRNPGE